MSEADIIKVIIVDDIRYIHLMLRALMEEFNYEVVVECDNGQNVIKKYAETVRP